MKTKTWVFLIIGAFFFVNSQCKKDKNDTLIKAGYNVVDVDGNVYHTLIIGSQVWMVEDLKTTRYNDATVIPFISEKSAWSALQTSGSCSYNNTKNIDSINNFGLLYNWYAVNTDKLCPIGWHVPTDEEWSILADFLTNNGYGNNGSGVDIAKSIASVTDWNTYAAPGTIGNAKESNNKTGFSALPGGYRNIYGEFNFLGYNGFWWSASEYKIDNAYFRALSFGNVNFIRDNSDKKLGLSIRCIKD